ncbi:MULTISPECIES: heme exporter protein CcmD [Shewanella]|uniref:heme exporter protein CcmD n=1 Tax=Shewanella TaxID=22 RepID=UPI0005A17BB0|nr:MULTISPECIES: heme exporter protein CcmD [Shewanella]KIO35966.1 transcriptional regulator [Shewanella sp. cp20]MCG9723348.1 heme exporter protein CcmD [Shewanella sp. Isolate7]MCG9748808.1 heme exporter protein CcmD [Shewanella sp. Isolate8]MCL2912127.1 heme exporter protein CcmD [Shewanella aquimarina]
MQFDSLAEFFNMGGYAFYVWLSYGITAFALGTLIVVSLRQKRKILTEISKKMQREERLKANRSKEQ